MRQREATTEEHSFNEASVGGIGGGGVLLSRRKALKLGGLATLGGALGLLSSPSVAQARRRHRTLIKLAAGFTGPSNTTLSQTGDTRIAQTFVPSVSGQIVKATVEINKSGSLGDYLFQINDVVNGVPNSIVFASTTVADRLVPEGISTVTAKFATPVLLGASFSYALVVSRPGSDNCGVGARIGSNAQYPKGDAWSSAGLTAQDPFHSIGSEGVEVDMVFSIYVKPI